MQSLVRIYNRGHLLTWLQDVEFSVYGYLFQAGRDHWGTAGMGGNGQFNRLSALDDIADEEGPWRDRLTEDQDLGLRLIAARLEGPPGAARDGRPAGALEAAAAVPPAHPLVAGQPAGDGLRGEVARAPFRRRPLRAAGLPADAVLAGDHRLGLVALVWRRGEAPSGAPADLAARLLLPARLRRHDPRLRRRRSGRAVGWLRGFLIAQVYAPTPGSLAGPAALDVRQLPRGDWAKTEREPLTACAAGRASRGARQTQIIASGCNGSRAQSAQRGTCSGRGRDLLRVDRHVDVGGKTASSSASSHQRRGGGCGMEDGEATGISATPLIATASFGDRLARSLRSCAGSRSAGPVR